VETTLKEIPYKKIALKVGRIVGRVYTTTFETQEVAVLKVDEITEEHTKLGSLSHPNIIPLLGYAARPPKSFRLILPYHYPYSLSQKLFSQDYTVENGMCWAQEVCNGLVALHSAGLLHLNLNLESVVFNQEEHVVLTNMNCLTPEGITDTAESLPFVAPEILAPTILADGTDEKPGKCADIYSFGVLLFCLAEQKKPSIIAEDKRETLSKEIPSKVAHLIKWCWKTDPLARPQVIKEVSDNLEIALKP